MKSNSLNTTTEENYIIELFKMVLPYKWFILGLMGFFVLLSVIYIYFTPKIYESYAIIKVKSSTNKIMPDRKDFLRDELLKTNTASVDEEITGLKTYKVNNRALEKVNFQIQYFEDKMYKKNEIYNDVPITVEKISNINKNYLGAMLTLLPQKNGFIIESKDGNKSELLHYNEQVNTPYFLAKVIKNRDFKNPIYIKLNGDNRNIYENIIKKKLSINKVDLESNYINISFKDTIPERANNYINALAEAYVNQSIEKKNDINNKILKFLDDQIEITKVELALSEQNLEKYQSKNKNIDPTRNATTFFDKLSKIDLELSEINLKEKLISNVSKFIKENKNLDAIAPTLLEFNAQSTIKLIDSLQPLKAKEDELKLEYTDSYPRLIQIRKRMAQIKKKVAVNIKNLASILTVKRQNLLKQKKKYEASLTALPIKEKQLISFKRSYEVNSKMYTYLLEKKSENELIKVASISDYEEVDKAYTSPIPVSPKKPIILMSAALIGLTLGIVFALIRVLTLDKVQTQKEVEVLTKLPIYGNIPLYKDKMLMNVSLEEAYRKLAMNIQFYKKEEEGNIVLISSSIQGEGKTTTLVNLSKIFQNTKYKSIIVDLDMHNPSLHKHFGLEQQYSGVSTYLSRRDNLGNVIFTTNNQNLNIITSGPTPPNPMELMLSSRLEELLMTLKSEYDYVFIDTGSFDVAIETFHLMQYSDINLVVLRENFSKKSSIKELEKLIRERHLHNIGLVLKTNPIVKKKINKAVPQLIQNKKDKKVLLS